jgi:hypothetical protein
MQAVKQDFINNVPFKKIYDKRALEFIGLNPEEIKEVTEFEAQNPMPVDPTQINPMQNVPQPVA